MAYHNCPTWWVSLKLEEEGLGEAAVQFGVDPFFLCKMAAAAQTEQYSFAQNIGFSIGEKKNCGRK